ncbi:MAG: DUF2971 domain-containing protein [Bacteroidales bacterium]|nr:DUF2971 domain-containing protein [Bacteroidales bacterium]
MGNVKKSIMTTNNFTSQEEELLKHGYYSTEENTSYKNIDWNTPIYKIMPYNYVLDMMRDNKLTLTQIRNWFDDDSYELFLLKQRFYLNDKPEPNLVNQHIPYFYGQSWSFQKESDALWRIYSKNHNSVKIKTTLRKLIPLCEQQPQNTVTKIGEINYVDRKDIIYEIDSLNKNKSFSVSNFFDIVYRASFTKMRAFECEKEFRIISQMENDVHSSPAPNIIKFNISPDFIEEITFDPRMQKSVCTEIEKQIKQINKKITFTNDPSYDEINEKIFLYYKM